MEKTYYRNNQSGFTLIELLTVVGIVGVLAMVAIPQYASYRVFAFNALAQSDLRNAVSAEEAYYSDNEVYVDCSNDCDTVLPGFVFSNSVQMNIEASADGFTASSYHTRGNRTYEYDTSLGFSDSNGVGGGGP